MSEVVFEIAPRAIAIKSQLIEKVNSKTKPIGALGQLEELAIQMGCIQNTLSPQIINPTLLVFAGDHGIAKTGLVNPYPQEVTFQMVLNFLQGGAAVNVFARQNGLKLQIIDAGVNHDFTGIEGLVDAKIAFGTANYLEGPAMTQQQYRLAIQKGTTVVIDTYNQGSNTVGFGEMGIGNTSTASLLMSVICGMPIEECIGRGTGVSEEQLQIKIKTLQQVIEKHQAIDTNNPMVVLQTFGGFEIAQMVGGMLQAAQLGMVILIDGFISTSAVLVAQMIDKNVMDYCVFTHESNEQGHIKMLEYMEVKPLLNIGMRLGEGSGIAVAYPIIQSACSFLNEMASFEKAQVTNK